MNRPQWARIREIFGEAMDYSRTARSAFLRAVCANDDTLRGEILNLLKSHERPGAIIDQPLLRSGIVPDAASLHTFLEGQLVSSRFCIGRFLGEGGMGEVYAAEDRELHMQVALKTLRAHLAGSPKFVHQFRHEIQLARLVSHPNVCRIFDVGRHEETLYLTMELLEGDTLAERLANQGRMSPVEAAPVLRQLCQALSAAHESGVLHRDFKSANVMLAGDRAVVTDFGLARLLDAETSSAAATAGVAVGTPAYMAPEQLEGRPSGPAADIYALGVVMYEMVTGWLPWRETSLLALAAAKLREPVPPGTLVPGIGREWESAILRCLAPQPEHRFATAREVAAAIDGYAPVFRQTEVWPSATNSGQTPKSSPKRGLRGRLKKYSSRGMKTQKPLAVKHWHLMAALIVGLAALSGLAVFLAARKSFTPTPAKSIAVLPFLDLSPTKDQEYFCDGMTDELISELARIDALRVVSRTSVFAFKGKREDVREVGRRLNVATVLEGSIRRAGDHMRITAQLISVPDGYHLWSESYDRESKDVFAVQEELSRSIAGALQANFGGTPPPVRDTSNLEAYNFYLLGRYHWSKRSEPELDAALRDFEAAVRLDPAYARAYAGLADTYVQFGRWASRNPRETMPRAMQYALKALELSDSLAEAHTSLGVIHLFYDWNIAAARREYQKAIALNPGYVTAHWWYAFLLLAAGQLQDAHREMDQALRLDPLSVPILADAVKLYVESGDVSGALSMARKALELDPTSTVARVNLGLAFATQDRLSEALGAFKEAAAADPENPAALEYLAAAHARLGQRQAAERVLNRLLTLSNRKYVACEIGAVYASAGRPDQALRWLKRAVDERSTCIPWLRARRFGGVLNPFHALAGNRQYEEMLAEAVQTNNVYK